MTLIRHSDAARQFLSPFPRPIGAASRRDKEVIPAKAGIQLLILLKTENRKLSN